MNLIKPSCVSSLFILVLLLACICFTPWSFAQSNKDETSLRQSIALFNQAFISADAETLSQLLHQDYTHTNSGNKAFGKSAWLKWVKSRRLATANGELVYSEYKTEDLVLHIHANSAVVTGRNIARGMNKNKPFIVDIRFTHLWVKADGKWQRAAFHDAKIQ